MRLHEFFPKSGLTEPLSFYICLDVRNLDSVEPENFCTSLPSSRKKFEDFFEWAMERDGPARRVRIEMSSPELGGCNSG